MAKKAQLEQKVKELEDELKKYKGWLTESENQYSKLASERNSQFENSQAYQQMEKEMENLKLLKESHEESMEHLQKVNKDLRNKIQELMEDNKRLKDSIKNQAAINDTIPHNPRNAGRHPKPKEEINRQLTQMKSLLEDGKKEREICRIMGVSRATFYRLKRLAKEKG